MLTLQGVFVITMTSFCIECFYYTLLMLVVVLISYVRKNDNFVSFLVSSNYLLAVSVTIY